MQSSPGAYRSRIPAPLWIAAIPLAALVVSLALAFGSAMSMRESSIRLGAPNVAPRYSQTRPVQQQPAAGAQSANGPSLWISLEPLAIDIDTVAVLGLAIVGAVQLLRRRPRNQT